MQRMFTEKDKAIIKYFLLKRNKPSYQKQISTEAGVSEQHLGDHYDDKNNLKKEGRLSKLVRRDILDWEWGKVQKRGDAKFYSLKEDPITFRKLAIEFLKDTDIAVIFTHSKYAQKMMDCVAKKQDLLFEDNDAYEELKKMLRLSPKMLELCLMVDHLGRKFLLVSTKIDYYGISELAFEKTFSRDKREGENKDYDASIKHYIRWQLFLSCLKTDVSFIVAGGLSEEIDDLLSKERSNRLRADATLNGAFELLNDWYVKNKRVDAYLKALSEELNEAFMNPTEFVKVLEDGEPLRGTCDRCPKITIGRVS
jgi:hypothetical protein